MGGVIHLFIAVRGKQIDDHPWCRQCRFDLFGLRPLVTCPECGYDLIETAYSRNALTEQQLHRYLEQGVELKLDARSKVKPDDPIPIGKSVRGRFGRGTAFMLWREHQDIQVGDWEAVRSGGGSSFMSSGSGITSSSRAVRPGR